MTEQQKLDILNMDEVSTYFFIDECGAFIFKMGHSMKKGVFNKWDEPNIKKDIINVQSAQQFAVDNLERFGLSPLGIEDKTNGNYWKWYRFWGEWKNNLSDKDWKSIQKLMKKKKSINAYLPVTKWSD